MLIPSMIHIYCVMASFNPIVRTRLLSVFSCNKQKSLEKIGMFDYVEEINFHRAVEQLLRFNHAGTHEGDCGCQHLFHTVVLM